MIVRLFHLAVPLVSLLSLGLVHAAEESPTNDESIRYVVSYRGIFSAMGWMDIADAVLRGRTLLDGDEPVRELELYVTSEQHGLVESVYPFRYRARSLFQPQARGSVAFERYKQSRKRKHDLFWLDRDQGRVVRFRPNGRNPHQAYLPSELAALVDPDGQMRCEGFGARLGDTPLFDRLSLLHRIRTLDLTQDEHVIPVTDGKRRLRYLVTREGGDVIEAVGRDWPAWKLKVVQTEAVDRTSVDPDPVDLGSDKKRHRPVYIWLSKDAKRLPLLFESRHAIGRFHVRVAEADYRPHSESGSAVRPGSETVVEFVAQARPVEQRGDRNP